MKPLITTIIPTYRRPRLLKRAIRSVLSQTYPHFQIRVYDNASGDETAEVVREFERLDSRVKYYCHKTNIGIVANYQYGREQVDTPYFSFFADDDILLPYFYETAMRGFKEYPNAAFSGGSCLVIGRWGQVLLEMPSFLKKDSYFIPPKGISKMLGKGLSSHLAWTSLVFRRDATQGVGALTREKDEPFDVNFILNLALRNPFFLTKKICAIFVLQKFPDAIAIHSRYRGWIKILHHFIENSTVSSPMKKKVDRMFLRQMQKHTIQLWLESLRKNNFKEAWGFLEVLAEQLQFKKKGWPLKGITKVFQGAPMLLRAFQSIYDIAKIPEKRRLQHLQESSEPYMLHLKINPDPKSPR